MATTTDTEHDTGRWGRIPAWWLSHPEIDADGLAVLAALSTFANGRGECWPSQATLASALKRSRSTVNRILGHLADAKVIEVEPRKSVSGGRLSCLYRLRLQPGEGAIVNTVADTKENRAVQARDMDVAVADSPCAAARQEQPDSEQIPDSLASGMREPVRIEPAKAVPADWMPSTDDLAWARSRHGDIDLAQHVEGFVLRCQAHGYRYRDVGAAWRVWLAQDAAAGKAPVARSKSLAGIPAVSTVHTRETAAEQRLGAWAAAAAELRQRGAAPIRS